MKQDAAFGPGYGLWVAEQKFSLPWAQALVGPGQRLNPQKEVLSCCGDALGHLASLQVDQLRLAPCMMVQPSPWRLVSQQRPECLPVVGRL